MGVTSDILIQIPEKRKHITGEPIKGLVKFHLDKDTVYKKISLSLVEKGHCQWYEYERSYRARHGKQARQRRKEDNRFVFEGHEMKVVKKIHLLSKNTDENITLSAGSYEHAFEMLIPENIPPSMKTDVGEIKYYLVLTFKKPRILSWNKKFQAKITLYPGVDSLVADKPLSFALDKTLNKLFSPHKNEIKLKAELKKGYLKPSSETQIAFFATNNSNVSFSVLTELISKTKYKNDSVLFKRMFYDTKTVKEVIYFGAIGTSSVSKNSVTSMFIKIPVAPDLCTVRHSKIIFREYKLRVTLKVALPHINSSVEVPVFVGERLKRTEDVESKASSAESPPYSETMLKDRPK